MDRKEAMRIRASKTYEQGDLIAEHEEHLEWLKLHGKFVDNQRMEDIMLDPPPSERTKYSNRPLPWEESLTTAEWAMLETARNNTVPCSHKDCHAAGVNAVPKYEIVTFKKKIPYSKTGNDFEDDMYNALFTKKFGPRYRVTTHVGAFCKTCGKLIKFVKFSKANRRLACDPIINGPHQQKRS